MKWSPAIYRKMSSLFHANRSSLPHCFSDPHVYENFALTSGIPDDLLPRASGAKPAAGVLRGRRLDGNAIPELAGRRGFRDEAAAATSGINPSGRLQ